MSTIRGVGGSGNASARWKNPLLTDQGRKALTVFSTEEICETSAKFLHSHRDTEDLRWVAERYRRRRKRKSVSSVTFELEPGSEKITVRIEDEVSGRLKLRMSPEQVEAVLQHLEETKDNEATLSSFFIDLTV